MVMFRGVDGCDLDGRSIFEASVCDQKSVVERKERGVFPKGT